MSASWTHNEAVALCCLIEAVAPKYGYHVALTGGCLYGKGSRADCDIVLYRIRQVESPDETGLFNALAGMGFGCCAHFGFCAKCHWNGKPLDLLFPESSGGDYQGPPSDLRDDRKGLERNLTV